MLLTLLTVGLVLAPPTSVPLRIAGASLFKNGYAVVVREAPVTGSGEFLIDRVPNGSLGTVWLSGSQGVTLEEAVTYRTEKKGERPLGTLDEVLRANVGKRVTLERQEKPAETGKLVSADGDILILQDGARTWTLPKAQIINVSSEEGLLYTAPTTQENRALRVRVRATGPGSVYIVSLEHGMTWAPAYSIDLSSPQRLKLTAKATVLNDLAPIEGAELRLTTGFPNVPYLGLPDPISSPSVSQFVSLIQGIGSGRGGRGGGFAGGGGRAGEIRGGGDLGSPSLPIETGDTAEGERVEDLFFHSRPNVSLQQGERGVYTLFTLEVPYERVHHWSVDEGFGFADGATTSGEQVGEVRSSLRFKNTGTAPLSTAAATLVKGDRLLGQDMMRYTAPGAMVELGLTKALEVRARAMEEQLGRQVGAVKGPKGAHVLDLQTIRGTLRVSNGKPEPIRLIISKSIVGKVEDADGSPKKTTLTQPAENDNSNQRLEWTVEIPAGQTKVLTYTYKRFIPS